MKWKTFMYYTLVLVIILETAASVRYFMLSDIFGGIISALAAVLTAVTFLAIAAGWWKLK